MADQRRVSVTKVSASGSDPFTYSGVILYADDQRRVARCPWPSQRTHDLGRFAITPGDVFIECYWKARWYNVFAIYDRRGVLKGWYCNICRPVEMTLTSIRWVDLALDLLVLPDGSEELLDQAEFAALEPSPQIREHAREALADLRQMRDASIWPFICP